MCGEVPAEPQEAVTVAWAFAAAQHRGAPACLRAVTADAAALRPRELSNLAWAAATVAVPVDLGGAWAPQVRRPCA